LASKKKPFFFSFILLVTNGGWFEPLDLRISRLVLNHLAAAAGQSLTLALVQFVRWRHATQHNDIQHNDTQQYEVYM
jgi:hypothetical protein